MLSIIRHSTEKNLPQLACLVVRADEDALESEVPPNREGEPEYGFKRGMVAEGLERQATDTDTMVLEHRHACFAWASKDR